MYCRRAMKRQRQGPQQLGALHENGLHHLDLLGRSLDSVPPDRLPQRLKQHVVGSTEKTADDDALRIDEVAQAGDRDADLATGI